MENLFGLDDNTINKALKYGILVKKNDKFEEITGFISLVYIQQLATYVLAYGTDSSNAGYVVLKKYGEDWKLK